jgi:hypothetical protein
MRIADADILFLPGTAHPPSDHWQTRWAAKFSTGRLLAGDDANRAVRDAASAGAARPLVLVTHGAGAEVLEALARQPTAPDAPLAIAGAFIVAPRGVAGGPLPFPAMVVASDTDPHTPPETAFALAQAWGAAWRSAGDAGALDDASGHGPWPEGLMVFAGFMKGLG